MSTLDPERSETALEFLSFAISFYWLRFDPAIIFRLSVEAVYFFSPPITSSRQPISRSISCAVL